MVPEQLKAIPQWLLWRYEPNEIPDKKPLKVPCYVNGSRRYGEQGSSDDRAKLATFDVAQRAMSKGKFEGVGFAFLPGDGIIGIDLDKVIDPATGVLSEVAQEIVKRCDSFTEHSPSGLGLHIFVRGDTKELKVFKSDKIGVEVYCNNLYFTVTGRHFEGSPDEIREISAETLQYLRDLVDEAKGRKGSAVRDIRPPKEDDFARVNDAAMLNLSAWVLALFPAAQTCPKGFRVTSKNLGRDLQEDLSITSDGIVDWGVNDLGDAREGRRTPIDLVIEWSSNKTPALALRWLSGQLGINVSKRSRALNVPSGSGSAGSPPAEGPGAADGDDRPVIKWTAGELPRVVNEAEAALMKTEQGLYQRGSSCLVRVVRRAAMSVRNFERPAGSLGIVMVDKCHLVELMTRAANWIRYDARADENRRINAPEQAAATLLARQGHWKLPTLQAAISAPTLRPDGTVLQKPGYDERTHTWYDPCGVQFPLVPENPTVQDATKAMDALTRAFSTFPFANEHDRSVALALALTALVRRGLPSTPMGAITAPVMGSGKTLLADVMSILATGVAASAMKYPETDEEFSKTLLAVLAEGDGVVLIDNVERPLASDALCTILTSETFRARMLGQTQMMTVPTSTLFLATGNQLVVQGDLRTRSLLCCIDPQVEKPEQREFKADLREWFTKHRPRLVVAGLTLMRAFKCSGLPASDFVQPWGRFERWSEMVRAPLVWMGCEDPCESLKTLEADDPLRIEHMQIMAAWAREFPLGEKPADAGRTARMAIDHANQIPDKSFYESLSQVAADRGGGLSNRRLGRWLSKFSGRIVDGKQFFKNGERDHVAKWSVKNVSVT